MPQIFHGIPNYSSFQDHIRFLKHRRTMCAMRKRRLHRWDHFTITHGIPSIPCCYVIYLDGVLSYVGSTINLRQRIRHHAQKRKAWQGKHWLIKAKRSIQFGDWLMAEIRLIKRLNPPFNKQLCQHES